MNTLKYILFLGIFGLLFSCEKDETRVVMLDSPVAPTLVTIPEMTMKRVDGTKTVEFTGTPVDPGFAASASYFLEAAKAGTNFADPVILYSGTQNKSIKLTVADLNGLLLKKFDADVATSVDFRMRSQLVVDAGTTAPGTSTKPFVYSSAAKTVNVTPYGLPRLDLVNSGLTQKVESALGDGKYYGFVKFDATKPFTLKDPDANIVYGANGAALAVNGAAIKITDSGWYKFNVDTKALTYKTEAYMIGLIGSATANGWNSPDQKMDYDAKTDTWKITATLIDGEIKFRKNDGWAWNLGGTKDNLTQGGANLPVTAGNYTITLSIINDATGTCTIVKN
jgi:hypothetical protein